MVRRLEATARALQGAGTDALLAEGKALAVSTGDAEQEAKRLAALPDAARRLYVQKGLLYVGLEVIHDAAPELHAGDQAAASRYNLGIRQARMQCDTSRHSPPLSRYSSEGDSRVTLFRNATLTGTRNPIAADPTALHRRSVEATREAGTAAFNAVLSAHRTFAAVAVSLPIGARLDKRRETELPVPHLGICQKHLLVLPRRVLTDSEDRNAAIRERTPVDLDKWFRVGKRGRDGHDRLRLRLQGLEPFAASVDAREFRVHDKQ